MGGLGVIWKVVRWLADRWYIPLFVTGALVAWLAVKRVRSQGHFLPPIQAELAAIEERARVRELSAQAGAAHARAYVTAKYQEDLERLDRIQRLEAEELAHDPAQLAAYLVRVGSARRTRAARLPAPGSGPDPD